MQPQFLPCVDSTHHAHTSEQYCVVRVDIDCLSVVVFGQTNLAHPQITSSQTVPSNNVKDKQLMAEVKPTMHCNDEDQHVKQTGR
jgi:hypothetical protein